MKTMAALIDMRRAAAGIMQMPRSTWLPSFMGRTPVRSK